MICQICRQEINIKGITLHLRKHKISSKDYYDMYFKKPNEGICMICKKPTEYMGITKGYHIGCCSKHTSLIKYGTDNPAKSNIVKEKVKQTCINKYGTTAFTQTNIFKEKRKETCLEKYGVPFSQSSNICKEKAKQTFLDHLGVENPSQSQQVQEKIKQNSLEKYGVAWPTQTKKVQEKRKQTNLEKYGVTTPLASIDCREKGKLTSLRKYGTEYPVQSKIVYDKIKQTNLEKYGFEYVTQNPEILKKAHEFVRYVYNNVSFDSSWELAVWIYFTDNNIEIEREPCAFDYYDSKNELHQYFPDFRIYGQIIEVKANFRLRTMYHTSKYKCMIDNNVIIWSDELIQPFLEYCKNKYSDRNWHRQFKINKNSDKN